jgi:hypothetical protein
MTGYTKDGMFYKDDILYKKRHVQQLWHTLHKMAYSIRMACSTKDGIHYKRWHVVQRWHTLQKMACSTKYDMLTKDGIITEHL